MKIGLEAGEIVISSLLNSPEAEKIKKEAGLVGDATVVEILLDKLVQPEFVNGVLVDGFPRTKVVICVVIFIIYTKLMCYQSNIRVMSS